MIHVYLSVDVAVIRKMDFSEHRRRILSEKETFSRDFYQRKISRFSEDRFIGQRFDQRIVRPSWKSFLSFLHVLFFSLIKMSGNDLFSSINVN